MPKTTDNFKEAIQAELNRRAEEDPLFRENLEKENKDIDGCINYILGQVKKIGAQGYTDDEIYGLAAHYYDEDDLEEADPINCNVVVNHKPELSDDEKKELREQVRKEVMEEERKRLHGRKPKITRSDQDNKENEQLSLI